MGVKLQIVLGVILVSLVCGSKDASSELPTSSTTSENAALDKPEPHINLIDKSPKTEVELKNVHSNTQRNLTSVKLNKTEPQIELGNENDNEKVENLSNDVVEKDKKDSNKENAIGKDLTDKGRDDRSRSIDAGPQKYAVPEYQRKNSVFTSPLSTDPEKYIDQVLSSRTTTGKFHDFDDIDLTTPKSYFFDSNYKAAVDSIEQKLEDDDDDMDSEDEEPQIEKLRNRDTTPGSNFMEFKEMQGMKNKTFRDKNSVHKDMVVMQVKRLNINTSFQDTEIYDDDEDKDEKYSRGETDKLETTTSKNNFILTTRKSATFTKPPIVKNNSYILSNNIETETFKAINVVSTDSPTTKSLKDYEKPPRFDSTTEKIQDNQIIPLHITTTTSGKISTTTIEHNLIPATEDDEETTTNSEEDITTTMRVFEDSRTIRIEENLTPTIRKDNRETTSSEEEMDSELPTTNMVETTAVETDYTTADAPFETTTVFERKTEPLIEEILTVNDEPTTLKDRTSTIYNQESTVHEWDDERTTTDTDRPSASTTYIDDFLGTSEEEKLIQHNSEASTTSREEEETTEPEMRIPTSSETTTVSKDEETTTQTEVRTTETGFRTSKSMNMANENETAYPAGSTSSRIYENSFPAVTETTRRITTTYIRTDSTTWTIDTIDETTTPTPEIIEVVPSDSGEVETVATTQAPTTTEVPTMVENTGEVFSTLTPRDTKTLPETTRIVTELPTTFITLTVVPKVNETEHLTTVPPETQTEEATEETRENYPPPTTTVVSFIRVATIGGNHTTVTYPPAGTEEPTDVSKPSGESIVITTTEDGTDTAATEGVTGTPEDKKGTIAAIVISTVGAVCLVLLAGLLYIMRKRQKRFNYGERCRPVSLDDYSVDNVSVYNSVRRKGNFRQSKRSYGNPAFDDPDVVSHPLNFPALSKFANNVDDIKAEFEEVPQIAARTSELPEGCETKNRYANVIPLPETRVCLKPIDGYPNSDYINANYVTGPKNVKGYYIATQAPMQHTVDDFWRMIWEQQTKVILMITHFFENGVEKCVDYLPPSEVLDCHRLFGDFQVTLKKRDVKDKYIISSLQLKNMVSNSWREVTHFWYMGWPEKGVPTEANSLIAFLIEARSYMKSSTLDKNTTANGDMRNEAQNENNPVVVHCSPGTGRTGVVIACDIAIREFEQTRLVDIPKIVYMLRRDRANAVQTKEQYMFIYKVVSLYATKLTGGSLDSL